nr:HupE/UreJ protein [uncultured organism]
MAATRRALALALAAACTALIAGAAMAHDVAPSDAAFVKQTAGPAFIPFVYLGAKHMVTGIDHVLFLVGVVFFLFRLRDVVLYVSMFAIGHSITLLAGVLLGVTVNAHIVDAVIGASVIYKGIENLGGFRRLGVKIDSRLAVLAFGLAHGLGLATKLLVLSPARDGLLVNLIGFNVGVEIGQILVLALVVALLNLWRHAPSFKSGAVVANVALVAAGIALTAYQIKEYVGS